MCYFVESHLSFFSFCGQMTKPQAGKTVHLSDMLSNNEQRAQSLVVELRPLCWWVIIFSFLDV